MVGYVTKTPGSQSKPKGLPVSLPNQGNFIGLLTNFKSNRIAPESIARGGQVGQSQAFGIAESFVRSGEGFW